MNSNNHHVMGNLNQVDNYLMNSNFQQQLFSDQGFADHHLQQQSLLQFTFCNDQIPDPNNHPLSSMNYESMDHFFPPAAGEGLGTANGLPESNRVVMNSSSHSGTYGLLTDNMSHGCKKRKRNKDKQGEKPREVVHVRAKRGQATDSHSLAERSRREKINEKLRCLQDLVPGCYKTMGMAVMLDVIINYVRSLQNQIDFLSMKLSAASLYYDFNSDPDTLGTILQGSNVYETQELEKLMGEGCVMQPQMHASWTN